MKFNVKRSRREEGRDSWAKSLFSLEQQKGHLVDAAQNINDVGWRKWSLSVSHLDTQYLE